MEYSERDYADAGIYISIVFARNANRAPAWIFYIENVEDELYRSGLFSDRDDCEREAEVEARKWLKAANPNFIKNWVEEVIAYGRRKYASK